MADETIATAGSGLVFKNTYVNIPSADLAAYRDAVVAAEDAFESHLTNSITLNVTFEFAPLKDGAVASNDFNFGRVSYAVLRAALSSHATTADDKAAVSSLPASDPSKGAGFAVPIALAQILGLARSTADNAITVILNSAISGWQFGSDAVGALEHEISEGAFGRIAALSYASANPQPLWGPLDLFRYSGPGQRSHTADGSPAYFSVDGLNLATQVQFHNQNDGDDLGDWQGSTGDAFGASGPGTTTTISSIDWRLLDVLGWTPSAAVGPADDYANSLADTSNPLGHASVGQSVSGTINYAGDRDWFAIQLSAGVNYVLDLTGMTLSNPFLQLHDSSGATIASNDDVSATSRDSEISFTPATTGVYYIEAAASHDSSTGTYVVTTGMTGTADDYANNLADTSHPMGQIGVNGTTLGNLDYTGDRDWFAVQLIAGTEYVLSMNGITMSDPYLRLHDPFGTTIAAADDTVDLNAQIVFTPSTSGTYYLEAGADRDSVIGHYTVGVQTMAASVGTPDSLPSVPAYRFFDARDGGHFFTTSVPERDHVIATRSDMQYEGFAFLSDTPASAAAVPVYRFFDPTDGGHFFTDNQTERDHVLASRPDLHFEGIGFYEHASPTPGYAPVYRFFDAQDGGHFFTASEAERAAVLADRPDLHYEGIGFYAPLT